MAKLGISKIECVDISNVSDYSFLPGGTRVKLSSFISGDPEWLTLKQTQDTVQLSEKWLMDDKGHRSNVKVSGSIRIDKNAQMQLSNKLLGRRHIFKVTAVDGTVYLVGSVAYPPKFTWQNEMSGISSSEIAFTIECSSSHGLYICI